MAVIDFIAICRQSYAQSYARYLYPIKPYTGVKQITASKAVAALVKTIAS